MTTIALAAPRTRLRLTARGRRFFAWLAALPLIAALAVAAVAGGGAALGSFAEGEQGQEFATVTVLSGDSLWSIAQMVAPERDPRDVVDAITHLNQLQGGMLVAGQELAIPAEYSAE